MSINIKESHPAYFPAIDYLRILFSWFVVIWHLGIGRNSVLFSQDRYYSFVYPSFSDIFCFNILLSAVPAFFTISAFLFCHHGPTFKKLQAKTIHFFTLALFWSAAYWLYQGGFPSLLKVLQTAATSPGELFLFLLRGGNTIFYFFISLSIVLLLTYIGHRLSNKQNIYLLLGTALATLSFPLLADNLQSSFLTAYWSPLNYLVYPWAAVLAVRYSSPHPAKIILLVLLSICLAGYEYSAYVSPSNFLYNGYAFPPYMRLSLACFSFAALYASFYFTKPLPPFFKHLANYSLALYLLHLFIAPWIRELLSNSLLIVIPGTILFSYLAAIPLKKIAPTLFH